MKPLVIALAATLATGCVVVPATPAPAPGAPYVDPFEHSLAPYGQWIAVAPYGRVWRPTVSAGWRPYLYGTWVWTDDGWFWASDEPWGWATYHYGRWHLDPTFGWVWIPGHEWAPAWVAWRFGGGYVGWAPLVPGVEVWWVDPYPIDAVHWVFVPVGSFVGVRIDRVHLPPARARPIYPLTRPAPPRAVAVPAPPRGGPPPAEVERAVNRPVAPHRVVPVPAPEKARGAPKREEVRVYRPAPPPAQRATPAPEREAPPPPKR